MIALYLIAAHLVGDFLLQSRWQAADNLADPEARTLHVAGYLLPFVPVALLTAPWQDAVGFLGLLAVLHFITDSVRLPWTPGDVLEWQTFSITQRQRQWADATGRTPIERNWRWERLPPPNPWAPTSIMVDQSLHVVQVAVLAGWLLA